MIELSQYVCKIVQSHSQKLTNIIKLKQYVTITETFAKTMSLPYQQESEFKQSSGFLQRIGRAQPVVNQYLCFLLFRFTAQLHFQPLLIRWGQESKCGPVNVGLNVVCCPSLVPKPLDNMLQNPVEESKNFEDRGVTPQEPKLIKKKSTTSWVGCD